MKPVKNVPIEIKVLLFYLEAYNRMKSVPIFAREI
jgi:hypothetical protein